MAKLYELTNELLKLENYDEFSEEHQAILDDVKDDIGSKIESIAKMIKNFEGERNAIKAEAQRMTAKHKTITNNINWLKGYIQNNMQAAGMDKIKGELLTVSLQNVRASVEITDEELIPDRYKTTETIIKISKEDILGSHKGGGHIPGVTIHENNKSVRIR